MPNSNRQSLGKLFIAIAAVVALAACGTRVARPVKNQQEMDELLTCEHVLAELKSNNEKIHDVAREKDFQNQNNVGKVLGLGLVGAVFASTGDAESKETEALQKRNQRLAELLSEKNCG